MAALSLILLPVTTETSTPTRNEMGFSSNVSQQPHDHHRYQNVHQKPQYQKQYQYTPSIDQKCYASTPEDIIIPHLSPTQSKAMNELVSYQRCWEAIHQRTIKQLEWVKGWWFFIISICYAFAMTDLFFSQMPKKGYIPPLSFKVCFVLLSRSNLCLESSSRHKFGLEKHRLAGDSGRMLVSGL